MTHTNTTEYKCFEFLQFLPHLCCYYGSAVTVGCGHRKSSCSTVLVWPPSKETRVLALFLPSSNLQNSRFIISFAARNPRGRREGNNAAALEASQVIQYTK